jgi:hypothetical protein
MAAAPLLFLTSISTAFFNPRESAEKWEYIFVPTFEPGTILLWENVMPRYTVS